MARREPSAESIAIGIRIQKERERRNLTREQLAESLDVTAWYINDIERGRAGLSVPGLIRLWSFFRCSADYILFGSVNNQTIDKRIEQLTPELRNSIDKLVAAQIDIIEQAVALSTNIDDKPNH